MSTLTVNWIHLALIGLVVAVVAVVAVGLLAFVGIVLHLFRGKPATPGSTLLQKAEAVAQRVEASPAGQVAVADVERLTAAVLARLQTAPPVTIPNHPALTAVADVLQKAAQTEAALQKVSAAVSDAHAVAQTVAPTAAK